MTTLSATELVAEPIFTSLGIVPGNIAISHDGRIFVSVNPLLNPFTKLFEILNAEEATPYPDGVYSVGSESMIKGALGINVDNHHRLWILDMTGRKFWVWDLVSETLQDSFEIDESVTVESSFLQDFAIDEVRKRIFIADMTLPQQGEAAAPAIVMIDMVTRRMTRLLEGIPELCSEIEGGFGLNPIAIDPEQEWLYFGAVHSRTLYRLRLDLFDDDVIDTLEDNIEIFSPKCYCDGIIADKNETVYVTNVEENAIGVATVNGFHNIAQIPEGQSWADGLALYDGSLYATLSQLDRSAALNNGTDKTEHPYMVVRIDLSEAEI